MEQEKVTEELVRQNGNQAAAVMADYASQGGGGGGIVFIDIQPSMLIATDADGNTLFTAPLTLTANLRTTEISCKAQALDDAIANSNVRFWVHDFIVGGPGGITIYYTSPVLNLSRTLVFIFDEESTNGSASNAAKFTRVSIRYVIGNGLHVTLDLCTSFDKQLSMQTGFPLFDPNGSANAGDLCIFKGLICMYTEDGYIPVDEYVDDGDTTMSRKIGLNVENSVFGQLLNMYHNTITGQPGGGGEGE